jgi:hypothetical protein
LTIGFQLFKKLKSLNFQLSNCIVKMIINGTLNFYAFSSNVLYSLFNLLYCFHQHTRYNHFVEIADDMM